MKDIEKKQRGGKRKGSGRPKGRTQMEKKFRIDDDLCKYLKTQVGNQNAFVNIAIRTYKEQSELIIGKIDNTLHCDEKV